MRTRQKCDFKHCNITDKGSKGVCVLLNLCLRAHVRVRANASGCGCAIEVLCSVGTLCHAIYDFRNQADPGKW